MLDPSIDSLMTKIDSKYSLVSVAAKRARHIAIRCKSYVNRYISHKNVGKALEEINADKLFIVYQTNNLNTRYDMKN